MASRRKTSSRTISGSTISGSSAVVGGETILATVIKILSYNGNTSLSPREIADKGIEYRMLQVPRGRTQTYLSQLVQSSLYNSVLSVKPLVYRTSPGRYKVNNAGLNTHG